MKYLITIFSLLNFLDGMGQLSVADISDDLLRGADAVYLYNKGEFVITEDDRAIFKVRERVAILNGEGGKFAIKGVWYDKLRKVRSFNAELFDQNGQSVRKLKNSDITDVSAINGFSVYEDNRVKIADLRQSEYPYIVEFEFEVEYKYLYHIPAWELLPDDEVSVMKSSFKITSPLDFEPRFKVENIQDRSIRIESRGIVTLDFEYENLYALVFESYQPKNVLPYILVSPSKFNFEGYKGDFSTWNSYGLWQKNLNKGLDNLPQSTISKMQSLVEPYSSTKEKARAIYEYLQNNTRYVSIQLGIGGYQPFANSIVDENGYGDCKALSFYTHSLLKSVGIESYYTKVFGGDDPPNLDPDFSANQFNHIILCVPNAGDTLWLECTSQTNPFGYTGTFTGNRDVLLITEEGGKLARTPYYPSEVNTQNTVAEINFDENLNASTYLNITYTGLQYEDRDLNFVVNSSDDEQQKWIQKNLNVPGFELIDFEIGNNRDIIPSIDLDVSFSSSKLFNSVGDRHFIQPNLFNRNTYVPERDDQREFDISIKLGYIDSDSLVFEIPETFRPEYLPEETKIESEFGSYEASFTYENGRLTYVRKILIQDGTFDKEKYNAFRDFRKSIVRADKMKIAFLKKT